jgi:hypothetical protein
MYVGKERQVKKKPIVAIWSAVLAALVLANLQVAFAEDWWLWCWHRGSTLRVWVFGSHQSEANAALDDWDSHTELQIERVNFQADISVIGANYGATPWWGLATIHEYSFDWWHHWRWCRIQHARARYNSYNGGTGGTGPDSDIRGVFAQEIGHCFGLEHSNAGDCMGKGYYNDSNVTGASSWEQVNARY